MNKDRLIFRGKRIDTGEWVQGSLAHCNTGRYFIIPSKTKVGIYKHKAALISAFDEIDPSTLGQATGLRDNTKWERLMAQEQEDFARSLDENLRDNPSDHWKGKLIFEGDLVKTVTGYFGNRREHIITVEWDDDIENDSFGTPYTSGYCIHGHSWEIIGNAIDHSELLKGENE